MGTRYKVVAPYVSLKMRDTNSGGWVFLGKYAGATVDADEVEPANLRHHLDSSLMVEEGTLEADLVAVPAGTPVPGEPPNVPVSETGQPRTVEGRMAAAVGAAQAGAGEEKPPPVNATKAAWVDWAESQGADRDYAESRTKDQLIAEFG